MRLRLVFLLCILLLNHTTFALADSQKRVTQTFVDADLAHVLKFLAQEMNRNIYIGPTVHGSVTIVLTNVPVEQALHLVLAQQPNRYDFKILDGPTTRTVVVSTPIRCAEIDEGCFLQRRKVHADAVKQEFLLTEAPADKVLDCLKGRYPDVEFVANPTTNGFYARGSLDRLSAIKGDLISLDRQPAPPPSPLRESFAIRHSQLDDVRDLMVDLIPECVYTSVPEQHLLIVEGSPGAIDQVRELLVEIDTPNEAD